MDQPRQVARTAAHRNVKAESVRVREQVRYRRKGIALITCVMLFAIVGQLYFAHLGAFVCDGVLFYGIAIVSMVALVRLMEPPRERSHRGRPSHAWGALAISPVAATTICVGMLLAVVAGNQASVQSPSSDFSLIIMLWLVACAMVVGARIPGLLAWKSWVNGWSPWLKAHRLELLIVTMLVLLSGVLRFWQLAEIPYPLSGDEANMGLEARRFLSGELGNPFSTGWFSHPTMWFYWQSWMMKLFGTDLLGLRMLSAIVGTSTVLIVYLLAREMFGMAVATISAAILACYPYHVHFSRYGINNISDACFAPLTFFFLYRGLERREPLSLVLGGAALGLMQYGYLGSRVGPIIVLAYVFYLVLTERGFLRRQWSGLVLFGVGALVVGIPIIIWYIRHPSDLTARLANVGLFQTGWLTAEQARSGRNVVELLWSQVDRTFLAFNFYRDSGPHYRPPGPLLGFVPSVLFPLGVAYAAIRRLDRRFALLLLWLGLALIFGGVLTLDPPFAPRLVVTIPAVCILVGLAIWKIVSFLTTLIHWPRQFRTLLAASVVGVIMLLDTQFYFTEYAPGAYFSDANTEICTIAGWYLRGLDGDYNVYFLGAPRVYVGHPPLPFLVGKPAGVDILKPLQAHQRPAMVKQDSRLVFIFVPERIGELETVREFFPDGEVIKFSGRFARDLFTIYRVD